jgi:hypothetical protein
LNFWVNLRQRTFARRFLPNAPHHHSPNAPPQEQSRRNGRRLRGGIQLTKPRQIACTQIEGALGSYWCSLAQS